MGRVSNIQHAMNAGEFSPLTFGRQDIEQYDKALAKCYNAFPIVQGPWTRRPGTKFVGATKTGTTETSRLFPYIFSTTEAYMVEIGNAYARIYNSDYTPVTATAQNITGATQASPVVVTYSGSDTYSNGDRVLIKSVVGMTQINNTEFIVANVDTGANTFELTDIDGTDIDGTGFDAYSSGGTVAEIISVVMPYSEAEVADLVVKSHQGVLWIFHPSYTIRQFTQDSAYGLGWGVTAWDQASADGPYEDVNLSTTTLTCSATTGVVTVTASATTGINGGAGFQSTDVGRLVRIFVSTTWGYGKISVVTNTTTVTVVLYVDVDSTSATTDWRLGLWSDTTGYPACGTFHQNRLVAGGSTLYPNRFDMSKSGNLDGTGSFAPSDSAGTVADDNAIGYTLATDTDDDIFWLRGSEKGLLVGTAGNEWWVHASSASAALTPTDIGADQSSAYGSKKVQPVSAGKAVLFVQRAGRKLREMAYVYTSDGYQSPDMTILAEHISSRWHCGTRVLPTTLVDCMGKARRRFPAGAYLRTR